MSAALSLAPLDPHALQGAATFILSLRARGVFDTDVLRAMETVPRNLFAPRRFADLARSDIALPLACGQTMTSPAVVAAMLAALDVAPGQRVLEIGTGSGYVAALLARMGAELTSFERIRILAESAGSRLRAAGLADRVEIRCGDGLGEMPGEGRCDRILLNGTISRLDPRLTSRLSAGGRLVGATLAEGGPRLLTVRREADGRLVSATGVAIRLSPLVEEPVRLSDRDRPATEV